MDTVTQKPHPAIRFLKNIFFAIFMGLVVGSAGILLFVRWAKTGWQNDLATALTNRTVQINTSQPAVISRIQRLQRLETVTYTMDKIVEGNRQSSVLPDFLVGDKLLLIVHGESIAGIDLSQLKPSDVAVSGSDVKVHLPDAQIFVTHLDSSRTRVFERATGLFTSPDPNLESEVRATAEQQLKDAAISGGILTAARQNATATITSMLLGLGFEHVEVK